MIQTEVRSTHGELAMCISRRSSGGGRPALLHQFRLVTFLTPDELESDGYDGYRKLFHTGEKE